MQLTSFSTSTINKITDRIRACLPCSAVEPAQYYAFKFLILIHDYVPSVTPSSISLLGNVGSACFLESPFRGILN